MLEVDSSIIGSWLGAYLWPFFRIAGFLMAAPILGTQLVPARVRMMLALLLTLTVVPILPAMPTIDPLSIGSMIITGQQVLIGIALGFLLQVLLQLFVVAGQLIAMQMGLGFAQMVDPTNGVSVTVVSQFHLMLVMILFLAMNGHLAMIEVFVASFTALPVGAGFLSEVALWKMAGWGGWMFSSALVMSLPALTSLLIINFSMGVVTRAAPQLNIFAVGFPFMLVVGLGIIWSTLGGYLPLFDKFTREALDMMSIMIQA